MSESNTVVYNAKNDLFPHGERVSRPIFHFTAPMQGSENASQVLEGEEDKIAFTKVHGAYFVETNLGAVLSGRSAWQSLTT